MKRSVLLVTFFGFLSINSLFSSSLDKKHSVVIENEMSNDPCRSQLIRFSARYCASVVLSGCIGATTGGLVKCIEKQLNIEYSPMALFLLLLTWSLESELRNEVIGMLQKDLDAYGIGHQKGLMYKTAWIASWMAYLNV